MLACSGRAVPLIRGKFQFARRSATNRLDGARKVGGIGFTGNGMQARRLEQPERGDAEGLCDIVDGVDGRIVQGVLEPADVGPVEAAGPGEVELRPAAFFAQASYVKGEMNSGRVNATLLGLSHLGKSHQCLVQ